MSKKTNPKAPKGESATNAGWSAYPFHKRWVRQQAKRLSRDGQVVTPSQYVQSLIEKAMAEHAANNYGPEPVQ